MIKADSSLSYTEVKDKYEYAWDKIEKKKVKNPLRFYNYHLIKEMLGEKYVMNELEGEDSSWGISLYNNQISYGKIKNDQLIYKNINSFASRYDWSFLREHKSEYVDMLYKNRYKKGNAIKHGYPDHAILYTTISI